MLLTFFSPSKPHKSTHLLPLAGSYCATWIDRACMHGMCDFFSDSEADPYIRRPYKATRNATPSLLLVPAARSEVTAREIVNGRESLRVVGTAAANFIVRMCDKLTPPLRTNFPGVDHREPRLLTLEQDVTLCLAKLLSGKRSEHSSSNNLRGRPLTSTSPPWRMLG